MYLYKYSHVYFKRLHELWISRFLNKIDISCDGESLFKLHFSRLKSIRLGSFFNE